LHLYLRSLLVFLIAKYFIKAVVHWITINVQYVLTIITPLLQDAIKSIVQDIIITIQMEKENQHVSNIHIILIISKHA